MRAVSLDGSPHAGVIGYLLAVVDGRVVVADPGDRLWASVLLGELNTAGCVIRRPIFQTVGSAILVIDGGEVRRVAIASRPRQAVGMVETDRTINGMMGKTG